LPDFVGRNDKNCQAGGPFPSSGRLTACNLLNPLGATVEASGTRAAIGRLWKAAKQSVKT